MIDLLALIFIVSLVVIVVQLLSHVLLLVTPWLQHTRLPCFLYPVFAQTHVYWVSDATRQSHALLPPSPPALNHSHYQGVFSSVQFSHSVVSDSLQPHGLQHTRLPCPSPPPRAYSNSCPSSWWCHPTISSSVVLFSILQSFPASGSFPMSQFFDQVSFSQ